MATTKIVYKQGNPNLGRLVQALWAKEWLVFSGEGLRCGDSLRVQVKNILPHIEADSRADTYVVDIRARLRIGNGHVDDEWSEAIIVYNCQDMTGTVTY